MFLSSSCLMFSHYLMELNTFLLNLLCLWLPGCHVLWFFSKLFDYAALVSFAGWFSFFKLSVVGHPRGGSLSCYSSYIIWIQSYSFKYYQYLMTITFRNPALTSPLSFKLISNCLLDVFTWIHNRHSKVDMAPKWTLALPLLPLTLLPSNIPPLVFPYFRKWYQGSLEFHLAFTTTFPSNPSICPIRYNSKICLVFSYFCSLHSHHHLSPRSLE